MDRFNKQKARAWLESHAERHTQHICATRVREALEAGGLSGSEWVSDYVQPTMNPGGGYRTANTPIQVCRW